MLRVGNAGTRGGGTPYRQRGKRARGKGNFVAKKKQKGNRLQGVNCRKKKDISDYSQKRVEKDFD